MPTISRFQPAWYAWFHTSLGRVFLAATARGLCALHWDRQEPRALDKLRRFFPKRHWQKNEDALRNLARGLNDFLEGRRGHFNPPLEVKGTAFQNAVWKTLRRVPFGRTISYRELATRAGHPRAVRAVANACGRNPVAIAIPCHRVIRRDGSIGGYRSGLWRKRLLLKLEGSVTGEVFACKF